MEPIQTILQKMSPPTRRNNWPPPPPSTPPAQPSKPACEKCGGLGYISANVQPGDPLFGKLIACECTAPERAALLQKISGLTPYELSVKFSDIHESGPGTHAMIAVAKTFVVWPCGMLTIWGGSGNAKTMILQAIVNEYIRQGRMAIYVTMLDLIEYIREAYQESQSDENGSAWSRMDRLAKVPILCIDEMDKVKKTDWVRERETALFDKRYRLGISQLAGTALAMNNDPATLPDWIYSRLSDGRNITIHNDDPDLRRLMK